MSAPTEQESAIGVGHLFRKPFSIAGNDDSVQICAVFHLFVFYSCSAITVTQSCEEIGIGSQTSADANVDFM